MMDFIEKKIEEIRRKPESARMVYVWGMVAAVMILVVSVWIITLRENLSTSVSLPENDAVHKIFEMNPSQEQETKPSLRDSFGAEGANGISE